MPSCLLVLVVAPPTHPPIPHCMQGLPCHLATRRTGADKPASTGRGPRPLPCPTCLVIRSKEGLLEVWTPSLLCCPGTQASKQALRVCPSLCVLATYHPRHTHTARHYTHAHTQSSPATEPTSLSRLAFWARPLLRSPPPLQAAPPSFSLACVHAPLLHRLPRNTFKEGENVSKHDEQE